MRVGVVGHRILSDEAIAFTRATCEEAIVEWGAQSSRLTALSALAEGADTVFARAAVEAGVPLDAVLPHRAYE